MKPLDLNGGLQVAPHEPSADVLLELMDDCSEGQHVDLHYPQFIACDTEDKVGSVEPIKKVFRVTIFSQNNYVFEELLCKNRM